MNPVVAAHLGKIDLVKEFFEKAEPADINVSDDYGDTPLHAACATGRFDIVVYLVEKGADVNARNKTGSTCLHKAVSAPFDSQILVKYLLRNGATSVKNLVGMLPEDYSRDEKIRAALQGDEAVELKVKVDKEAHGRIIGKGGATLREIQLETKTVIKVPDQNEEESRITVKGRKANAEAAKRLILRTTMQRPDDIDAEGDTFSARLRVPKDRHNRVIGRGGASIRDILAANSSLMIYIPKDDEPGDEILVRGDSIETVNAAVRRILELSRPPELKATNGTAAGFGRGLGFGRGAGAGRGTGGPRREAGGSSDDAVGSRPVAVNDRGERRPPREGGGSGPGYACYNCGAVGHISRDCPKPRQPRDASPASASAGSESSAPVDSDAGGASAPADGAAAAAAGADVPRRPMGRGRGGPPRDESGARPLPQLGGFFDRALKNSGSPRGPRQESSRAPADQQQQQQPATASPPAKAAKAARPAPPAMEDFPSLSDANKSKKK